ncbi:MAG: hypothetical protein AVDCRST_MAG59-931, partial [uncultured Thermomicrobiales bacterium]
VGAALAAGPGGPRGEDDPGAAEGTGLDPVRARPAGGRPAADGLPLGARAADAAGAPTPPPRPGLRPLLGRDRAGPARRSRARRAAARHHHRPGRL